MSRLEMRFSRAVSCSLWLLSLLLRGSVEAHGASYSSETRSGRTLRFLGEFGIDRPAFITSFPDGDKDDLVVSSFGVDWPWNPHPDVIRYIPKIDEAIAASNFPIREIKGNVLWPNEVKLLNDGQDVVVAGGFLVPFKNPGHISTMSLKDFLHNPDTAQWTKLIQDKGSAFFHRVEMVNVYGKGTPNSESGLRMVSCRGWQGFPGGGEMVYLEPNSRADGDYAYEAKLISAGCDTFFEPVDLNKDGIAEFIIPQFYSQKLVLMWTDEPSGDYTKPEFIRHRVIDDKVGKAFDCQLTDLDLDGQLEILVTNHQNWFEHPRPALMSYKMSLPWGRNVSDFMNGIVFDKVEISGDFVLEDFSPTAGSPGAARAVNPADGDDSGDYPVIIASGDGSFKAYLLARLSSGLYSQQVFHDCKGTVGEIHVKDVNGDGWKEVFVPCYGTNKIAVYTFQPPSSGSVAS